MWITEEDGSRHYRMSVKEYVLTATALKKSADDYTHHANLLRAAAKYIDEESKPATLTVASEYEHMAGVANNLAKLNSDYVDSILEHATKMGIDPTTL